MTRVSRKQSGRALCRSALVGTPGALRRPASTAFQRSLTSTFASPPDLFAMGLLRLMPSPVARARSAAPWGCRGQRLEPVRERARARVPVLYLSRSCGPQTSRRSAARFPAKHLHSKQRDGCGKHTDDGQEVRTRFKPPDRRRKVLRMRVRRGPSRQLRPILPAGAFSRRPRSFLPAGPNWRAPTWLWSGISCRPRSGIC